MKILNEFTSRQAALSKEYIYQIFSNLDYEATIKPIIQNQDFLERLMIGSEELYFHIQNNDFKLSEKNKLSLLKYILRSAYRTMPFGLFASIDYHSFKMKEEQFQSSANKKVRPSIEWYMKLVETIEQNQNIYSELKLYVNSELQEDLSEYFLLDSRNEGEYKITVKKNNFTKKLIEYFNSSAKINEVLKFFSIKEHEQEQILNVIKQLIDQGILISELKPSNTKNNTFMLNFLLEKSELLPPSMILEIKEIQQEIQMYEQCPIGQGIDLYQRITKKMQSLIDSKKVLIVDHFSKHNFVDFSQNEVENIVGKLRFMNSFKYFSSHYQAWENYCEKFEEEYGLYTEVPIMKLLDDSTGIGIPKLVEGLNRKNQEYNIFITTKINECLLKGESIIYIDTSDIKRIESITRKSSNKINDGYDIKLSFLQESGKFIVAENSFSSTASSFVGRFNNLNFFKKVHYEDNEWVSAEINIIPDNYSDLGVTFNPASYIIDLEGNMDEDSYYVIKLKDIVIGHDEKGIYAKSLRLNKKILPVTTHMLFYSNFNESRILLFLSQLGDFFSNTPKDFYLGIAEHHPFVPRIEYDNIILSKKRWTISISNDMKKKYKQEIIDYIKETINEYKVDSWVCIKTGDRELPICTSSNIGLELIYRELINEDTTAIILVEAPELIEKSPFNQDFIVSVYPEIANHNQKDPKDFFIHESEILDDWVYYDIYFKLDKLNALEVGLYHWFEENLINNYFFVYYFDTRQHMRVRFLSQINEPVFKQLLKQLIYDGVISSYKQSLFIPEISRYGGKDLYLDAINFFCDDTKFYAYLISNDVFKGISKINVAISVIIYTFIDIFDSYESALVFSDNLVTQKKMLSSFKKRRSVYIKQHQQLLIKLQSQNENLFIKRRNSLREYIEKISIEFSKERKTYIMRSLFHMVLNRFTNGDGKVEQDAYELAKYIFYNMKYYLTEKEGLFK